jgi:hypothetical protein
VATETGQLRSHPSGFRPKPTFSHYAERGSYAPVTCHSARKSLQREVSRSTNRCSRPRREPYLLSGALEAFTIKLSYRRALTESHSATACLARLKLMIRVVQTGKGG